MLLIQNDILPRSHRILVRKHTQTAHVSRFNTLRSDTNSENNTRLYYYETIVNSHVKNRLQILQINIDHKKMSICHGSESKSKIQDDV